MDDPLRAPWAKSRTGRARNANRAPSRFAVRDARLADRLEVRFATQKLTSNGCPAAVQQRGAIQGDVITRPGEVIFAGCCHWRQRGWVGRGLARPDRQSFSQGPAIVQLVGASAEIAMAGSHRRMLVVDFGGSQYSASARRTASRRPLLSASFCVSRKALRAAGSGAIASETAATIRKHGRNQSNSGPGRRKAPNCSSTCPTIHGAPSPTP